MTTKPKADDDPHRWEVEPHPYSSDFDCLVTDSDVEARTAILEAAEMYLWDGNEGGERVLKVRLNKDIPETPSNAFNPAAPVVDEARYDEAMDDRQKLGHQLACAATAFEDAVTQLKAVVEDAQIRVGASANCYNEPKEAQSGADYVASRVLTALETMKSSTAAATTAPVEQSDEQ